MYNTTHRIHKLKLDDKNKAILMEEFILQNHDHFIIEQRMEHQEFFGFEGRNKYDIFDQDKKLLGHAAEQGKGIGAFIFRNFLKHWRTFDIHFFTSNQIPWFRAHHPFRFYFQTLQVYTPQNQMIGAIEKQFSILSKKFLVLNSRGQPIMNVSSGLFRLWRFEFLDIRTHKVRGLITKKHSNLLKEIFTDADIFQIQTSPHTDDQTKMLFLAAGVYIDLLYFENNKTTPINLFGS